MAKSTSLVPSRLDRIAKKTGSISNVRTSMNSLPHDIIVSGRQAVEVPGYLLSVTDESVTIRHKRGHGSSKQIISTYSANEIIERVGVAGGVGSLTVVMESPVRTLHGQIITVKGNVITARDVQTGEITTLHNNIPGYTVRLVVDESVAAKKYAIDTSKNSGKASKDKKSGKKSKKSSDGEDF